MLTSCQGTIPVSTAATHGIGGAWGVIATGLFANGLAGKGLNGIDDPVRVYSHGMRQRLALAQALLPRPELLLLDEPAEGLDPEGIHEMRHLILRLNRERGMTVLLSSHLLSEVEQICDRIAVLNQGRMIFEGQWTDLMGDAQRFRLDAHPWDQAAAEAPDEGDADDDDAEDAEEND